MKLLKTHLVLIVLGVLVLAGLITLFWPLPGYEDELKAAMTNRLASGADRARSLADQTVYIDPSGPDQKPYERKHTAVTSGDIAAKEAVLKNVERQADETARAHAKANQRGRVNARGVPLLGGQPFANLLPRTPEFGIEAHEFRKAYLEYTQRLLHDLTVGPDSMANLGDATDAPTEKDIQAAKDQAAAQRRARAAAISLHENPNNQLNDANLEKAHLLEITQQVARTQAQRLRTYASPAALPILPMAFSSAAPNAKEIFEAFVYSWVLTDVVHAVNIVNGDATNVAQAPFKRLLSVTIGANAARSEEPGAMSPADSPAGAAPPVKALFMAEVAGGRALPGQPGENLGPEKTLTGRIGTAENRFDVTEVHIIADMTPSAINRFINALYAQSDSYTVLNVRSIKPVDPIAAASNGYLYGPNPVVRVDMLVEVLFFREWTKPIMPEAYKRLLHITDNAGGNTGNPGRGSRTGFGGGRGGRPGN